MSIRKGVDVYSGTGKVGWLLIKEVGYSFAMIKPSEGHTLVDQNMSESLIKAVVAGLHTGAYHWLHAVTTEEAAKEVAFFLNMVRDCKMEHPVALDVKQGAILRLSQDQLTDIITTWYNQVQQAGYYMAVYVNLNVS